MNDAEQVCLEVYKETNLFKPIADKCRHMGFEILLGPPHKCPPYLFLGYQPGNWEQSPEVARKNGYENRWPEKCEYATARWKLAKYLRNIFGEEMLEKCVGLNAIFVRAKSIETYEEKITRALRAEIRDFCIPQVMKMINVIRPQRIVTLGFKTLDLFGGGAPALLGEKTLTKKGKIGQHSTIAMLHPTGFRISEKDNERIKESLLAENP